MRERAREEKQPISTANIAFVDQKPFRIQLNWQVILPAGGFWTSKNFCLELVSYIFYMLSFSIILFFSQQILIFLQLLLLLRGLHQLRGQELNLDT